MRVAVKAVFLQDSIEIIHATPILFVRRRFDLYDCMNRLSAGEHQARDGKLQLADDGVLLLEIHAVGFNERIAEVSDILIFDAFAVQRVEPNPGTGSWIVVAEHSTDVPAAF